MEINGGESGGGKTRLFEQLREMIADLPTVCRLHVSDPLIRFRTDLRCGR